MIPSLLGISVVLFSLLALAPGDPFDELATNPAVPPEVRAALRAKFGLDDPVWMRYWHWLIALLQGDWGFSFVSRMDVSHADHAAPAGDPDRHRRVADPGHRHRHPGRRSGRDPALFSVRPGRQHLRLHRLLAADLLHGPGADPGLFHPARLAALRLSRRHRRDRLGVLLGAHQAVDHAGHRARPVPGRGAGALREVLGARTSSASTTSPRRGRRASASARSSPGTSCARP